jgi:SAM-dependent methyltransferase
VPKEGQSSVPDFSPVAREYAAARPTYPRALYERLAGLVDVRRQVAWDCATGSGQAARGLAEFFDRVIATDVSAEQLSHAEPHPRIEYRVAPAERSGLQSGSVDLITVAAGIHWFDVDAFFREAQRVARSGGVLAAWTYHLSEVNPGFDERFARFYREVLRPYFSPRIQLVDDHYATLELPGEPIDVGEFEITADWMFEDFLAFVRTWSGYRSYRMAHAGEDPLARVEGDLRRLWGAPDAPRTVRWPIHMKVTRL